MPKKIVILLFLFISTSLFINTRLTHAGKCDDIQDLDDKAACLAEEYESTDKKLGDIRDKMDSVNSQITDLSTQLNVTQDQINNLYGQIQDLQNDLAKIKVEIADRKDKLDLKIKLRNTILRNYSKRAQLNQLELFFGGNFGIANANQMFNQKVTSETLKTIGALNTEIFNFEAEQNEAESLKNELESSYNNLVAVKAEIDRQQELAKTQLATLSNDEKSLEKKLSELSAKQKEILNLKYGDANGTIGDYESPSAKVPDPPFANAFGAFSYGAFTHYKGMSQYGAKGRAEKGQSYKDIIEFYFDEDVNKDGDFPDKIKVQGYGEMNFQTYLYGLAEMPSTWPKEALRAQAVAGRSYAYRTMQGSPYKNDGGICTTQSCQVFSKSKSDNPPSDWKKAVDDTKDEIIGGSTGASGYGWYSSTAGGYIDNIGWDLNGGSWPGSAFESVGDSPWFYWAWYSKEAQFTSDKCGLSHPWLNEEGMADILNSWVVWTNDSGNDHISPITTSCWGGDPYSHSEMADKAASYGSKFTGVSDVDVDISNSGYTSKVTFQTNLGTLSMDGATFKTIFNLRAPGYIAIRSRLFDIEYRP